MNAYEIEVKGVKTVKGVAVIDTHKLRVRGDTEGQAIMSAYAFLQNQYDGCGKVLENTLVEV